MLVRVIDEPQLPAPPTRLILARHRVVRAARTAVEQAAVRRPSRPVQPRAVRRLGAAEDLRAQAVFGAGEKKAILSNKVSRLNPSQISQSTFYCEAKDSD